jgi:hypothetical protein
MRFIRLTLFTLIFILTIPLFAQSTDPTADLDETYTLGTLTLRYPTGMAVADDGYQIFLVFDPEASDYINLATPESFDYFGVDRSTLDIATQNVYQAYADATGITTRFADAVTQTTIGGYEAYTFTITAGGFTIVAFAFSLNDAPYVITLFSQESVMPIEDELLIMTRIVESMVITDIPAEATSVFTEVTPDLDALAAEITPEADQRIMRFMPPRDIPAGASDVVLNQEVAFMDGEIVFAIPDTWTVDEALTLVGDADRLLPVLNGVEEIGADELVLQFLSPSRIAQLNLEVINRDSVLTNISENFADVMVYTYDDWATYYMPVVGQGIPRGAFFMIIQIGEAEADVLVIVGVADDFDEAEATIIAIVNSMIYTPRAEVTPPAP